MADLPPGTFSPLAILSHADPVVQGVLAALVAASIASWAIIIDRGLRLASERRKAVVLARAITRVTDEEDLRRLNDMSDCAGARVLQAVGDEWQWSIREDAGAYSETRARIASLIDLAVSKEAASLAGATSILATIGSTAPFVGLFGTVWGIMRAFVSIGQAQDTSLAVVAPGIAEALMATAVGLACAIPAVIGYNRLLAGLSTVSAIWRRSACELEIGISRSFTSGRKLL